MNTPEFSPRKIADECIRRLKKLADPLKAAGAQRYFKEEAQFLGISSPDLRELGRHIYEKIRADWGIKEATDFCSIMLRNPYHEARGLGILIFERYRKDFPTSVFATVKRWLEADFCDTWALVDLLCPNSMGALLEKYPDLLKEMRGWTKSPNRWVRRASIVSFIKLAKKPAYLDAIYEIAGSHFADPDDLIQKANGWLLREAGKADMVRLERFLRGRGPSIPRTTLRYAIERYPEAKRKALLLGTK
ncbi:MAG: DNA alkylation repair protein [Candidatus Aminicenantes bacterium]|nr:DNA alkylation repair protein [Candidatus Aminicenantes bacterium]